MPARRHPGRSPEATGKGVQERILDAAIAILGESGLGRLTQVRVAERAGVRQSHLTYYFPTRDDLLTAVTARAVAGMSCSLRRAVGEDRGHDDAPSLARLVRAVADEAHMRMLLGTIVEADGDPAVRAILVAGTDRMVEALAGILGGRDATERARLVLAAAWGVGLYQFLVRPPPASELTEAMVAWIGGVRPAPGAPGAESPS